MTEECASQLRLFNGLEEEVDGHELKRSKGFDL